MAKVALFKLMVTDGDTSTPSDQAAFLLDDPNVGAMMGGAMLQRLVATPAGQVLTYTAEVFELANPPT